MNTRYIKKISIFLNFIILALPITGTSKSNPQKSVIHRPSYKPVSVYGNTTKGAQPIGIYKRAKIGKDGAYGTFTKKHTIQSQTVLEHNSTTTPIVGVTNKTAVGYILNSNPSAGSNLGSPTYLALYPYSEPLNTTRKATPTKPSMKMRTAQYMQKK